MTTLSPLCRRVAKSFRYSMTSPPELPRIRTSPAAGVRAIRDKAAANTMRRTEPSLGQDPSAMQAARGGRNLNRIGAVPVPRRVVADDGAEQGKSQGRTSAHAAAADNGTRRVRKPP